jgi:hypothetical protein
MAGGYVMVWKHANVAYSMVLSQHLHGDTDAPMTNLGHVGSIGSNPVKT